jgi:hypothetical protein
MARLEPHKLRHQPSNGDRFKDRPSPSSSATTVSSVATASPSERVATEVPNDLPPDDELSEAEISYRKELDDFLTAREAERGDPWPRLLGPLLRAEEVRELVGLSSLEALDDLVRGWRILALPTRQGGVVYPAFQFDHDGQPHPSIAEVIEILAPVAITPYTIASWLMSPNEFLGDETPMQMLKIGRDPQRVITEARYAADHMAHF